MSKVIEEQVVKMQFDNKGFESNVQQSMSTLDKLKAALHFKDVNLTPLEKAFQQAEATATQAGFHIKDIWLKMSETFETQIANKIVNTGEKIAKALTIQGAMDGFNEYELKMGSIQTIMAGTGESLATVNKYLDELNTYSDKTIYSFKDMTSNIGKFTNAGVSLKDAVAAIKGVANVAAVSGANANEASRAMYNFSQALSAGYVKLIDWKSIENANMATVEFKSTLLEVAEGLHTVKKNADGTYDSLTVNAQGKAAEAFNSMKNFNDSLQAQWMNTEVLTQALEIYSTDVRELNEAEKAEFETKLRGLGFDDEKIAELEALGIKAADAATEIKTFTMLIDTLKEAVGSGWATSWQIIIGDFEEAKELWTNVGDALSGVIGKISDARNEALDIGLRNNWDAYMKTEAIPAAEVFRQRLTEAAVAQGKLTEEEVKDLDTKSKWIKYLQDKKWITSDFLRSQLTDYEKYLSGLDDESRDALSVTEADIETYSKSIQTSLNSLNRSRIDAVVDSFSELGGRENLLTGIKNILSAISEIFDRIAEAWYHVIGDDASYNFGENILNLTKRFKEFTEQLKPNEEALEAIQTVFTILFRTLQIGFGAISSVIKGVAKLVLPMLNLLDAIVGVIGQLISAITGSDNVVDFADRLAEGGEKLREGYLNVMQKIADKINEIADAIRNWKDSKMFKSLQTWTNKAKTALSQYWEEFKQLPIVQEMMTDFNNVADKVSTAFENLGTKISEFFSETKNTFTLENLNTVLTNIYHGLKNFKDKVIECKDSIVKFFREIKSGKSIGDAFRDSFSGVIDFFTNLKTTLTDFFEKIFESGDASYFDELATSIHNFFTTLDADKITAIVLTTVFGLFAINLLRLTNAVSDTVKSIGGTFTTLKNVINSYMKKQKSVLLQIAEAIVIVAGALYVLSTIDPADMKNALNALYAITGCILVLTVIMGLMTNFVNKGIDDTKKLTAFGEMAFSLVAIAGTIVIAAFALKEIAKLDLGEGILKKLGIVLLAVGGMATIATLLSKVKIGEKSSVLSTALSMAAVAGAMYILALSFEKINAVVKDPEQLKNTTNAMLKMMAGIAVIAMVAGNIGGFSALGILAVVLLFEKLMPRIEDIINYDYTKINEGLEKNAGILKKLGGMVGIMIVLGGLFGKGFSKLGTGLIKIVAIIGLLALITKAISKLNYSDITKGINFLEALVSLLDTMMICIGICNLMTGEKKGLGFSTFLGIALSLGVMALIGRAAKDLSTDEIKKEIMFVGALTGLVDLMFIAAGKASKGGSFKSLALVLAGVSFILGLMITLSLIKDKNGIMMAMVAIGTVILTLSAVFAAMGTVNQESKKIEGNGFSKSGVSNSALFLGLAAVAAVLAAMIYLSKQPFNNILAAGGAIGVALLGLMFVFSAVSKVGAVSVATDRKRYTSIITACIAMAAVALALGVLVKHSGDAKNMAATGVALGVALLGLSTVVRAFAKCSGTVKKDMNYKKMLPVFLGAIGSIIFVAGALIALSRLGGDPASMLASSAALTVGLVGVAIVVTAMGFAAGLCEKANLGNTITIVAGAIASVAVVADAIWQLSKYDGDPNDLIKSAIAIGIGALAVGAASVLIGVAGRISGSSNVGNLAAIVIGAIGSVASVAYAMYELASNITPEQADTIVQIAPSFAFVMGAFGAMVDLLAAASKIAGVVDFTSLVSLIGGAFIAIGSIILTAAAVGAVVTEFEDVGTYICNGLDMLVIVFEKIGEMVGKLVGNAFGEMVKAFIEDFGESMDTLMEHIQKFADGLDGLPDGIGENAKNLAEAMGAFLDDAFVNKIADKLGIDFSDLDMEGLGNAISGFVTAISTISPMDISKANTAAQIGVKVAEFMDLLRGDTVFEKWFKGKQIDLGTFGENLSGFASGISEFAKSSKDISDDNVKDIERVLNAAASIRDFAATLESYGGFKGMIFGDKTTIGEFGDSCSAFGTSMFNFVQTLVNLEALDTEYPDKIVKISDAVVPLNTLSANLIRVGGKISDVIGYQDLKSFSDTFVPFATNVYDFCKYVKDNLYWDFKPYITKVTDAVQPLADLADAIKTRYASFLGILEVGEEGDLGDFGKEIKKFAKSVAKAAEELGDEDIDLTALNTIKPFVDDLVIVSENAGKIVGDNFKNIKEASKQLGEMDISAIADAFDTDVTVSHSISVLFDNMLFTLTYRMNLDLPEYTACGENIVMGLKDGIYDNRYKPNVAVGDVFTTLMNTFSTLFKSEKFEDFGRYAVEGLANGITKNKKVAEDAAKDLAKATADTTKKGLEEESPSKLTTKFGVYWDEGLAIGIRNGMGSVIKSTEDMTDEVVNITNNVISSIADSIDTNMDFEPTIRPVVDTSDISEKAKTINKLLGANDLDFAYNASRSFNSSDLSFARNVASSFGSNNSSAFSIGKDDKVVNNYNFTQNNNSPKALSRMEIYRQTNNQINMLRSAIG